MATTTCMPNSFRKELLSATHNFAAAGGDTFKVALVKAAPAGTYNKSTANYSDLTGNTDEVSGTGYTAGGATLASNVDPSITSDVALTTWSANPSWTTATFTATAAMIYNSSKSNKVVSLHDFGGSQSVTAGAFTLVMPTANNTSAILRLA